MPANKKIFQKYLNSIFIETGSYCGDGIQLALNAGFKKIYSIELSSKFYAYCVDRFRNDLEVNLIFGDSSFVLYELLNKINESVTFWLDAHYSGEDTAMGEFDSPLMQELDIIKRHYIKTHTLIIDDLRCWNANIQGFDMKIIKSKCLEINSQYSFVLEDGYVPNDILVAKINK